jgi:radical SAM protein with 4Fe4S-binding SPASM domain
MLSIISELKKLKNAFSSQILGYVDHPANAFIEVNYDCVLRCKMCQLWTTDFKKYRIGDGKVLSQDEIEKIIDKFASAGIKEIAFLGGEPFLRKDLCDLVAYCKVKKLSTFTVSNGYLIGEDLADRIVRSGLDLLAISIDGPNSEIHDRIRGVNGSFDRAVKAITLIKKRQKELLTERPLTGIACTVSSNNFLVLPDMVDLAKSLDVGTVRFQYISVIDRSTVEQTDQMMGEQVVGVHNFVGIPPSYLVPKEHLAKLEDVIAEIRKRAGTQVECGIEPVFFNKDKRFVENGTFPVWDCNVPWSQAFVTPTGDLIPCPMFPDYKLGNIREKSFEQIWNGRRARGIRKRLSRGLPPICQKCCFIHSGTESRWKKTYRRLLRGVFKKHS